MLKLPKPTIGSGTEAEVLQDREAGQWWLQAMGWAEHGVCGMRGARQVTHSCPLYSSDNEANLLCYTRLMMLQKSKTAV